jgi:hypothetical protein
MARRLALQDVHVLDEEEGGIGLGAVGVLPKPMASDIFIEYVKENSLLKWPALRIRGYSYREGGDVRRAGSSLIGKAMERGLRPIFAGTFPIIIFFTPKDLWSLT